MPESCTRPGTRSGSSTEPVLNHVQMKSSLKIKLNEESVNRTVQAMANETEPFSGNRIFFFYF